MYEKILQAALEEANSLNISAIGRCQTVHEIPVTVNLADPLHNMRFNPVKIFRQCNA